MRTEILTFFRLRPYMWLVKPLASGTYAYALMLQIALASSLRASGSGPGFGVVLRFPVPGLPDGREVRWPPRAAMPASPAPSPAPVRARAKPGRQAGRHHPVEPGRRAPGRGPLSCACGCVGRPERRHARGPSQGCGPRPQGREHFFLV